MIQRCNNSNYSQFKDYGGRGIEVCDRWKNSFKAFLDDMGEPGIGMSLDRIDNSGNYEPGNCRWATRKQQRRNSRSNRYLTWNGKTQCLTDWAAECGVSKNCLIWRLKSGWSLELTLTTPSTRKVKSMETTKLSLFDTVQLFKLVRMTFAAFRAGSFIGPGGVFELVGQILELLASSEQPLMGAAGAGDAASELSAVESEWVAAKTQPVMAASWWLAILRPVAEAAIAALLQALRDLLNPPAPVPG